MFTLHWFERNSAFDNRCGFVVCNSEDHAKRTAKELMAKEKINVIHVCVNGSVIRTLEFTGGQWYKFER